MPSISMDGWELHNVVKDEDGGLRTRKAFANVYAQSNQLVGALSVRSPTTTEVWQYLFSQATTGIVTLIVTTEEFVEMFRVELGVMPPFPVFTMAQVNNQIVINSPGLSAPLYGLPGGGLITMTKLPSVNLDTTALDVPAGFCCSFGDRVAIAQGAVLFFSDPGVIPRTFVAENLVGLPGSIFDIFQAVDGALWIFTSAGIYTLPSDALGQGQTVFGFLSKVPGLLTSKPRNAAPTSFGVCVLDRDALVVLGSGERRIPIGTYKGRRKLSKVVEVEDLRQFGQLYPTPNGVLIGFGTARDFYISVDLRSGAVTYVTEGDGLSLVGVLTTRDGEPMHAVVVEEVDASYILAPWITGTPEYNGYDYIEGVAAGRVIVGPFDDPIVRRVTVSAANPGAVVASACSGNEDTGNTTTTNNDIVIGANLWSNSGGPAMTGRTTRSTRMTLNVRTTEPNIEVQVIGGDRRFVGDLDVQLGGTWRVKKEKQE